MFPSPQKVSVKSIGSSSDAFSTLKKGINPTNQSSYSELDNHPVQRETKLKAPQSPGGTLLGAFTCEGALHGYLSDEQQQEALG